MYRSKGRVGADARGRRGATAGASVYRYHTARERETPQDADGRLRRPTPASIPFSDIESLVKAVGGTVTEREGSRVKIALLGEVWHCHRPHPGKEAKRYQLEEARALLERVGVKP